MAVEATAMPKVVPDVDVAGVNVAVAPTGRPLTAKLTVPVNPLSAATLIASVPDCPCTMLTLLLPALKLNVGAAVTTSDTVVVDVIEPEVPAIVSG